MGSEGLERVRNGLVRKVWVGLGVRGSWCCDCVCGWAGGRGTWCCDCVWFGVGWGRGGAASAVTVCVYVWLGARSSWC